MAVLYGEPLIIGAQKVLGFNVFAAAQTPAEGKPGDICLIITGSMGTALISPVEPSVKAVGDVWIVTGDTGGVQVTVGEGTLNTVRLLGAQQWDGAAWKKLDGFVWVGSEWVQFGRKGMLLKDLPKGTLVHFNKNYPKNRIVEPYPQSPENVAFLIDNSKKYFDATFNVLNEKEQAIYNELSEIHKYIIEIQLYTCEQGFEKLESKNIFTPGAIEMTGVEKYPATSFKPKQKFWTNDYDTTKVLISRDCFDSTNAYVYYNSYVSSVSPDSNYQTQFGVVLDKNTQVSPTPNPDGSYNLIF